MVPKFKNQEYMIYIVLETIKRGHAPGWCPGTTRKFNYVVIELDYKNLFNMYIKRNKKIN